MEVWTNLQTNGNLGPGTVPAYRPELAAVASRQTQPQSSDCLPTQVCETPWGMARLLVKSSKLVDWSYFT